MELALAPFCFFDPAGEPERGKRAARETAKAPRRDTRLYCAHCRHAVTDEAQRIDVSGAHTHTCTNPHGLTFRIGCFRRADGCSADAAATTQHTWFPGYAWQIAYCAKCSAHLGWRFTARDDGFYGLIVGRLVSGGAGPDGA